MSDASSWLEEEILTLERQFWELPDASALSQRLAALEQSLWNSWSSAGYTSPPAPPPSPCGPSPVASFPNVCACLPSTITLHDSYYGTCPITFSPTTNNWTGCKLVNYPTTPLCPAASNVPIFYTLYGSNTTQNWTMQVAWYGTVSIPAGNVCPKTGTCSTKPTYAKSATSAIFCSGATMWSIAGGNQGSIYPNGITGVLTINLPAGT